MKICPKTVHLPWPLTIPVYHIISYTLLQIFHQIWSSNVCNFALFIILSTYTNITFVGLRVKLWVTLMILPSRRLQYSLIGCILHRLSQYLVRFMCYMNISITFKIKYKSFCRELVTILILKEVVIKSL